MMKGSFLWKLKMKAAQRGFPVYLLAFFIPLFPAWIATAEEDPIGAELATARRMYSFSTTSARSALLKAFDDEMLRVASKGDLEGYKFLRTQKAKAERGIGLSELNPMRKHQVAFSAGVIAAKKSLAIALDSAVKKYTMSLEIDQATAVQDEYKALIKTIRAYDAQESARAYNQGDAYRKNGKYDKAISGYSKAISLSPEYAEAYRRRGLAYCGIYDYDRAIEDFNQAIRLQPDGAGYYLNRGIAFYKKLQLDKAIGDFSQAIELKPNDPESSLNRGIAYYKKRQFDKAIEDFTRAISSKEEQDQSLEDLNKEFRLVPDSAPAYYYYNRGIAFIQTGDDNKAISDFTQAIRLKPDDAETYYNRGLARGRNEDYTRAIADFTRAIQLKPGYADAYYSRGVSYKRVGNAARAKADSLKARALRAGKKP